MPRQKVWVWTLFLDMRWGEGTEPFVVKTDYQRAAPGTSCFGIEKNHPHFGQAEWIGKTWIDATTTVTGPLEE